MHSRAATKTQPEDRADQAVSVGSLVVYSGPCAVPGNGSAKGNDGSSSGAPRPAIVCGIDCTGLLTIYVLEFDDTTAMYRDVPRDVVTQLTLAVRRGLVLWPHAIKAAENSVNNATTVHVLLRDACVFDGCFGELKCVLAKVYNASRQQLVDANGLIAAHEKVTTPPSDAHDISGGLPRAVLRRLRDSLPFADRDDDPRAQTDEALACFMNLSGHLRAQTVRVSAGKPGSTAEIYRREMARSQTLQHRIDAAMRAFIGQQRAMDACHILPLEALMAAFGAFADPYGSVAHVYAETGAVGVSYAPNMMYIAKQCVEHVRADGASGITLVDVGAGCGAALAAFHAAMSAIAGPAGPDAVAGPDGRDVVAGPDAVAGPAGPLRSAVSEAALVYRGSNVNHSPYDHNRLIVAGEAEGVVLTGVLDFTRISLGLVEPQRGDPMRTSVSGRRFLFKRWTKNGKKAVVVNKNGKEMAVERCNVVLDTVVMLAWAPDRDGDNFFPDFLSGLLKLQRPLAGLLVLVVGEGHGGCTGDGHPFAHRVLSATQSLNELGFSQWRAQIPGIMSKATLFSASDLVHTLQVMLRGGEATADAGVM